MSAAVVAQVEYQIGDSRVAELPEGIQQVVVICRIEPVVDHVADLVLTLLDDLRAEHRVRVEPFRREGGLFTRFPDFEEDRRGSRRACQPLVYGGVFALRIGDLGAVYLREDRTPSESRPVCRGAGIYRHHVKPGLPRVGEPDHPQPGESEPVFRLLADAVIDAARFQPRGRAAPGFAGDVGVEVVIILSRAARIPLFVEGVGGHPQQGPRQEVVIVGGVFDRQVAGHLPILAVP